MQTELAEAKEAIGEKTEDQGTGKMKQARASEMQPSSSAVPVCINEHSV